MKVVCVIEEDGYATARAVSNDAPEDMYAAGAVLGPPSLSALPVPEKKLKALSIDLVKNDLYTAPLLMGKRQLLFSLLDKHGIDRSLLRNLIAEFQQEYYGE